jgi:lysine 2-monooxygenase
MTSTDVEATAAPLVCSDHAAIHDVVIVGMGPAGLYTAWRLATTNRDQSILDLPNTSKKLSIAMFDTMPEERVGGRLCTQPLPGYPFLAELGGMRFRSNQLLINALVDSLGLARQKKEFKFEQKFYFLREQVLTDHDFRAGRDIPYVLTLAEAGKLPHEIIQLAIHQTLKKLTFGPHWYNSFEFANWGINIADLQKKLSEPSYIKTLLPKEWAVIKNFGEYRNNDLLYNVGFWDLLQFQLSSGAWHLAHDGLGYESIMGNWNSAIALPWFITDFDDAAQVHTLQGGMSSITDQLYDQIKASGKISLHHRFDLTGIDLISHDDGKQALRLQFKQDGQSEPYSICTRAVVLAIPKGALVRLDYGDRLIGRITDPGGVDQRSWFLDQLNSVEGKPLFKLFLGYSTPWWTKTKNWRGGTNGTPTGKVNTDLPLRQIYYYGTDQWNENRRAELGLSEVDQHSMVMASYSDSHYIEFWTERQKKPGSNYCSLNVSTLPQADQYSHQNFGAPASMIVRAEHQLGILHNEDTFRTGDGTPRAKSALYMEWSRPPYYAGWHSWKLGVEPWKICELLTQPFDDVNLFICGEAYSDEQGWTEGAFKSAERVLTLKFKLPLNPNMAQTFDGVLAPTLRDYIDSSK